MKSPKVSVSLFSFDFDSALKEIRAKSFRINSTLAKSRCVFLLMPTAHLEGNESQCVGYFTQCMCSYRCVCMHKCKMSFPNGILNYISFSLFV